MTISDEIQKLQTNLTNSYSACEEKGATLPEQQNFDNLPATIEGIEAGVDPSEYTKFGITINDLWYNYPNPCNVFDENAPHLDLSHIALSGEKVCWALFSPSRIKSLNTPYSIHSTVSIYRYIVHNNLCIQYLKINPNYGIGQNYIVYCPAGGCTNLKVLVIDLNRKTTAYGAYSAYTFGGSGRTNSKIRSIRFELLENIRGNNVMSYLGGQQKNLQTLWVPDLVGVSKINTGYNNMQNMLVSCDNIIGLFMPKLEQIGYTATGSSYGQLKTLANNKATKFPYLYLPALKTIYNVSTTASNGTFASSTGIKKVYFPALSIIGGSGGKYIFNGCSNLTEMHFGKENQTSIEGTTGYDTLWGRGAGNATVYFDLINKIVVNGKTYQRTQYNDYMTQLTYNDKVYYRDDSLRDSHNVEWQFWAWKSDDGSIVYTQNPLSLVTECVWEYISGDNWDYNQIGDITANDWRYGWTNVDDETDIIYTTNQWTPAVNEMTYTVTTDGKSFIENVVITEAI